MTSDLRDRGERWEVWLVAAWSLLPLLPFVTRAVSIDAPVFISVAHQIVAHPLDPFGFQMIWDPTSPDVWVFNRNPPLLSYYLALWIAAFGEVDTLLHVAMMPFSLLAALSFLGIARRVGAGGARPALLLVATPVYLVLATTVMLDVFLLSFLLLSVYAMLRGVQEESAGWQLAAGGAAAAAGLSKYIGLCSLPLLAAGVVLFHPRPVRVLLRVLSPAVLVWTLWALYTAALYGSPHLAGSTDVVFESRRYKPEEIWNHVFSAFVYFGCGLIFPILLWGRGLLRGDFRTALAVLGVIVGTLVVQYVLPGGEPTRRALLQPAEATFGALGCAAAVFVWGAVARPGRLLDDAATRFLLLWLGGIVFFSAFLNWHVNAADALLAAPATILLVFRDPALRPSGRSLAIWLAVMMPLSLAFAWADRTQANVYRTAAAHIAAEIGDQHGARYFVGNWGFQHYLEREGFQSVVPPHYGRSDLEVGDWVASARNVSQLDVSLNMSEFTIRPVWSWPFETWLPLRTTNADAGSGFYSHHGGHVPFAWSDLPIERIDLGRVVAVGKPRTKAR
ncbi:MAG: glycosyltransferase family 39 protein [Myxococcota bacterium]